MGAAAAVMGTRQCSVEELAEKKLTGRYEASILGGNISFKWLQMTGTLCPLQQRRRFTRIPPTRGSLRKTLIISQNCPIRKRQENSLAQPYIRHC